MSRHRVYVPGLSQHVVQRGNNRADLFHSTHDYVTFLRLLDEALARFAVKLHAYTLMTNHVHLVVTPSCKCGVANVMKRATGRYVRAHNRWRARTGGLYEGRYRAAPIDNERYWLTCVRYVELNPVRAGIVSSPGEYRWSSYAAHALGAHDPLVSPHPLYDSLGASSEERARRWQALCADGIDERELVDIRQALYLPAPVKTSTPAE